MLTVKLVQYDGHEQIHPAKRVWADDMPENGVNAKRVYALVEDGAEPLTFQGYGAVYVMNSSGATIANYFLGHGNGSVDMAVHKQTAT